MQTIDIQQLDGKPFIALDHGLGRIQSGWYYYIHHFNISSIRTHLEVARDQFEDLPKNLFSPILSQQLNYIDLLLQRITPIKGKDAGIE